MLETVVNFLKKIANDCTKSAATNELIARTEGSDGGVRRLESPRTLNMSGGSGVLRRGLSPAGPSRPQGS